MANFVVIVSCLLLCLSISTTGLPMGGEKPKSDHLPTEMDTDLSHNAPHNDTDVHNNSTTEGDTKRPKRHLVFEVGVPVPTFTNYGTYGSGYGYDFGYQPEYAGYGYDGNHYDYDHGHHHHHHHDHHGHRQHSSHHHHH